MCVTEYAYPDKQQTVGLGKKIKDSSPAGVWQEFGKLRKTQATRQLRESDTPILRYSEFFWESPI
ncbi:hypothetical protein A3C26_01070 [Candidatus Daviesbacteria bacterium RIFCSPHIGHO2_02_FULL_39_12]|uniref:Uncharacterized protein n=1 Tax=Candidatus Daviesbacteria bacterium RIFCSPHIGHO2_02_FULL_39_12 TaxID=1797770 RepID=A0A1F5JDM1_9BACT|nr:MAG: hypothetical protein A3C26_01070 [Candidatus Daviesbacteria bacterium RIFCSPHIGHO2_02_FULL_39_12]